MTITVMTVHPEVTIVRSGERQFELPTEGFPVRPAPGQTWEINFLRRLNDREKTEQLNQYLG